MIQRKMRRAFWMLAVLALCMTALAGCRRKYEPMDLPTVEEEQADITPESSEGETEKPAVDPVKETSRADGLEQTVQIVEESLASQTSEAGTTAEEITIDFRDVDETIYITADNVNLRKGCTSKSEIVTVLEKGTSLQRTGYQEEWSRVIYKDEECYIASRFVSKNPPPAKTEASAGQLIAIDPGHQAKGNSEQEPIGPGASEKKAKVASGTQGVTTGLPEYKLTLAVSLKLKEELESRGYRVYMIRETNDVDLSNAKRAQMANESGADIFVRVHANSLDDSSVRGTLTMCQTSKNPYNGELYGKSAALSKLVAAGVSQASGFKNRGVQETDTMSGINWCKTPVTIVEMGFMSNAEEDKKMSTEECQSQVAKGIADGIDAYYAEDN